MQKVIPVIIVSYRKKNVEKLRNREDALIEMFSVHFKRKEK